MLKKDYMRLRNSILDRIRKRILPKKVPCIDCLTLSICKGKLSENTIHNMVLLIHECSILRHYVVKGKMNLRTIASSTFSSSVFSCSTFSQKRVKRSFTYLLDGIDYKLEIQAGYLFYEMYTLAAHMEFDVSKIRYKPGVNYPHSTRKVV